MQSLHQHSNYSLLKSTLSIDEIVNFAKINGSHYACLTDTNSMAGLIKFGRLCEGNGIKPIYGCCINTRLDENEYAVFLAKNFSGYSEICKIITARHLDEKFSLLSTIQNASDNLFIFTPSIELLKKIKLTKKLLSNLFAELIVTKKQKKITRQLYDFARFKSVKVLASNPGYFGSSEDYNFYKIIRAIGNNSTIDNLNEDDLVDNEFWLKNHREFTDTWKSLPEAIHNVDLIVQNCNVDLELGRYKFPVFPVPPGETSFSYLWKITRQGLSNKFGVIDNKISRRLEYELNVIEELGFCDYFLIVWDIVKEAHTRNMVTVGRGSAANSLVAYCLNLTQVNPIKYNLYFERFLNKGRSSPPDVDIDFSWKERDQIVKYVFDKYGYDKVAMISTTVTFRARSAFRETAKVFGVSGSEISKFSKQIPWTSAKNLSRISKFAPEAKSLNFSIEPWKTIVKFASKLSGFPRHLSIHPSGLLITEKPITDYTALEYAKNKGLGLIITQPDMYSIEDIGLIKIDLLSQRGLGVLRDTLSQIN